VIPRDMPRHLSLVTRQLQNKNDREGGQISKSSLFQTFFFFTGIINVLVNCLYYYLQIYYAREYEFLADIPLKEGWLSIFSAVSYFFRKLTSDE